MFKLLKRIIQLALICGIGWYVYESGIFYNLTHEMQPEVGRQCEVAGPIGEGVDACSAKDSMKWVIDAKIGTPQDKMAGRLRLERLKTTGEIATLADRTPVRVVENGTLHVLGYRYPLTQVEIAAGEYKGASAWVQREDVIDTPIQKIYQTMRCAPQKKPSGS
jgi:hypothetical protein